MKALQRPLLETQRRDESHGHAQPSERKSRHPGPSLRGSRGSRDITRSGRNVEEPSPWRRFTASNNGATACLVRRVNAASYSDTLDVQPACSKLDAALEVSSG